MKTKAVSYAYPSSPTAEFLGHGKTGCYYLEVVEHDKPRKPCDIRLLGVFASKADALKEAEAYGYEFSRWSLR
jgi:hypothetical protein